MDYSLLEKLCCIPGASGNESAVRKFIFEYIHSEKAHSRKEPVILHEDIQDCLGLIYGKPEIAIFAHMDTTGYMVRYENQLIPIGSPGFDEKDILIGRDSLGEIECRMRIDRHHRLFHDFPRAIDRGTYLTYKPRFRINKEKIETPYLDNRLGIWVALQLARKIDNAIIFFTTWEEHGGGSVAFLSKLMFEEYGIKKALISDVTWVTDGIHSGKGVVISMKDRHIPRRTFINGIIDLALENQIAFQLEVEDDGSSDGGEIQKLPFPIDWCFIGPPVSDVHSRTEKVTINDVNEMLNLYECLLANSSML